MMNQAYEQSVMSIDALFLTLDSQSQLEILEDMLPENRIAMFQRLPEAFQIWETRNASFWDMEEDDQPLPPNQAFVVTAMADSLLDFAPINPVHDAFWEPHTNEVNVASGAPPRYRLVDPHPVCTREPEIAPGVRPTYSLTRTQDGRVIRSSFLQNAWRQIDYPHLAGLPGPRLVDQGCQTDPIPDQSTVHIRELRIVGSTISMRDVCVTGSDQVSPTSLVGRLLRQLTRILTLATVYEQAPPEPPAYN